MKIVCYLYLFLLPNFALAQQAALESHSPRIDSVLDGETVIVSHGEQQFICSIVDADSKFDVNNCKLVMFDLSNVLPSKELLVRIIEANGCQMTDEEAEIKVRPLFSPVELRQYATELESGALLEITESGVVLKTENCQ